MSDPRTLVDRNQSQLVSVEEVQVQGAADYDDDFIRKQFSSVFKEDSFGATLKNFNKAARRLQFLGLSSSLELDVSDKTSKTTKTKAVPIKAKVIVGSAPSYWIDAKATTRDDVAGLAIAAGNSNVIGGAETVSLSGEFGSRPRSFYNIAAESSLPINSSVWTRAVVTGYVKSADQPWASHIQTIQGGAVKLAHTCGLSISNQFIAESGLRFDNRVVDYLSPAASDSVRSLAGESIKASFFTSFTRNKLDSVAFPKRGSYLNCATELGVLPNFVGEHSAGLFKTEIKALTAMTAPQDVATLSLTGAFGFLNTFNSAQSSSVVDRFFLGGYKDVYGFQYNGLGPHDGDDAIGGDGYIRGGICIYRKFPTFGSLIDFDSPLRFLMFFNGARLVKFDHTLEQSVWSKLQQTLKGPISSACGLGMAYKTPAADFELVYNVPLSFSASDATRKGWQFGLSLSLP